MQAHASTIDDLCKLQIGACKHSDLCDPDSGFTLLHYAMIAWRYAHLVKQYQQAVEVDIPAAKRLFKIIDLLYQRGADGFAVAKNGLTPFAFIEFDNLYSGYANLPANEIWQIAAWQSKRTRPICEFSHQIRYLLLQYSQTNYDKLSSFFSRLFLNQGILMERLQVCKELIEKLHNTGKTQSTAELEQTTKTLVNNPDWRCGPLNNSKLQSGAREALNRKYHGQLFSITNSSPEKSKHFSHTHHFFKSRSKKVGNAKVRKTIELGPIKSHAVK